MSDSLIRTPDQRLRVFVSSTLQELGPERQAVRDAVQDLRLAPVMFELGARPHPPREVYRSYLAQSHVFVGVYWQSYGWVAPGEEMSGLEDEYRLSAGLPRLIYLKSPALAREARLTRMLARVEDDDDVSFQRFSTPAELQRLVGNDLALLLSERFETARPADGVGQDAPLAGTLPVPLTALVGREREVEALRDLLLRDEVRLVTLTGPGGVGKTSLATAVAGQLAPDFPDGVRFVELGTVQSADLVASALAGGLGLSSSGDRLVSDVKSYLRARRLLVVLDNFEQVAEAAPLVADLLAAAAGIAMLVTSRAVLRLSGEHEFQVPPLRVPETPAGRGATDALQFPAVRLFVERAQATAAGFELTGENAEAVAEICRRLDGLPLAIELAAAKVGLLSPEALLKRLDHRLRLLTGGARDVPERQRTLRATLDWSFDLLAPREQQLFARLGVFAGGFDLPAAEAISGDGPPAEEPGRAADSIDTLASLLGASLLRQAEGSSEQRFMMLETIREYALERLGDGAQRQEARDRHAAYFLALAEQAAPELEGAGQVAGLDRLEAEHDNLGAAMAWLIDQDDLEPAVQLGWVVWRFWWFRGHAQEWARYGEKILSRRDQLSPFQLALALSGTAFMLLASGDDATAEALLEQSLPLFRKADDKFCIALTASNLGHLSALRHDYGRGGELLKESLALQQDTGNDAFVSMVYNFLGQISLSEGDHDRAAQLFTEGLGVSRRALDRFPLLVSLYDLALSTQKLGDLAGAAELLKEGLSLSAEAGDQASVAYHLQRLAVVSSLQDRPERAVLLQAAANALLEATGSGWLHAYVPRAAPRDDAMADLRSRMGDAAFAEAQARGGSMEPSRAVRYALEGT